MTATRDEPKSIDRPLLRSSRVEWPEATGRGRPTFGSTILYAAVFGGTHGMSRLLRPGWAGVGIAAAGVVAVTAFVVLRGRGGNRHRARAVATALAAGRPTWDDDWAADRATARRSILERPVPVPMHLIGAVLVAMTTSFLIDASDATERWIAAGVLGSLVTLLFAWVVFRGGAQVTFERFPYIPGTRATFFVATTPGSPRLEDASVMLRCVGPAYDLEGRMISKRIPVTKWSRVVDLPPVRSPGPDEFVEVTFDIPADRPGTALHADAPVRWELLVSGRTRWGRLVETFVVPVYAAPV